MKGEWEVRRTHEGGGGVAVIILYLHSSGKQDTKFPLARQAAACVKKKNVIIYIDSGWIHGGVNLTGRYVTDQCMYIPSLTGQLSSLKHSNKTVVNMATKGRRRSAEIWGERFKATIWLVMQGKKCINTMGKWLSLSRGHFYCCVLLGSTVYTPYSEIFLWVKIFVVLICEPYKFPYSRLLFFQITKSTKKSRYTVIMSSTSQCMYVHTDINF